MKQGPKESQAGAGSALLSLEETPAGCLGSVNVTGLNEVKTGDKGVNAEPRSHPPTPLTHCLLIPFGSLTTGLPTPGRRLTNHTLPLIHILLNHRPRSRQGTRIRGLHRRR